MKKLILLGLLFVAVLKMSAQEYVESFTLSDIAEDLTINEIMADQDGNVTVIGEFYDSLDLDPGPNVTMVYTDKLWDPNGFIASYTSSGQFRWGLSSDSLILWDNSSNSQAIQVYEDGTTYFLCRINGTVDLDPGAGTSFVSDTGQVYVVKIDADGIYSDHYKLTDNAVETASFAMDEDKNIYLFGSFEDKVGGFDANGGTGTKILYSNGMNDNFIAKYNSVGQLDIDFETFNFGTTKSEYGGKIWVDELGHILIYGGYNHSFTRSLEMSSDTSNSVVLNTYQSRFLAQYNTSDCSINWAYSLGANNSVNVNDIFISSIGDIFITGEFNKDAFFNIITQSTDMLYSNYNSKTIFIAKYDSLASLKFAKKIGHGASLDIEAESIHLDTDSQVVIMGGLYTTISFNTIEYNYDDSYSPNASGDIYIVKYNSQSGEFVYVDLLQTTNTANFGASYMLDSTFYVAGNFLGTIDLDPDTAISEEAEWLDAGRDIFVAKYQTFFRDTVTADTLGGFIENTFDESIHCYPNPANNHLNISLDGNTADLDVKIMDINGKVILQQKKTTNKFELNFEGSAGCYFLHIESDDKRHALIKIINQ
jgi:hypothetical protein